MRTRVLLSVAAVMIVLLFITGACSAGFVAGRFVAPPEVREIEVYTTPDDMPLPEPQPQSEHGAQPPAQEQGNIATPVPNQDLRENTPRDLRDLFDPFWQAWDIVQRYYVDQPVDEVALMRGAIRGMLEALGDQHTSYMDPDEFTQANIPLEQEYEGIGAWVDTNAEFLTIVSPMPDSPAEKAGLQPGDEVIAVDGDDMNGIDGNLVVRRVLGPAGSDVTLTIRRYTEGEEPEIFDVRLTRAKITVHSVTGEMLDDGIAYININSFADNTDEELREIIQELLAENPQGLIIDVRNNGGGFLQTAIEVTSEFIGDGTLMIEEYGDGRRDIYEAIPGGLATDIPLVVLVNEGTASASEILAGAIQDYERGQLVGVTTFGKGSVQNWVPLEGGEEGAVRVTIARWLTPNERQIHEIGLEPDLVVELTEEDFENEVDPQLDAAIELLLGTE